MTTGERIFGYRKKAGFTQEELADRLGVSRQAVSKWEQDAAFPETDKVLELCKLFSVSADELLFGRENAGASTEETPAEPPTELPETETVHSEEISEAQPTKKPKRDVSKKWNPLCIFGFLFAAASVGIIFFGIFLPLFRNDPELDIPKSRALFVLVCMGLGLLLSVAGLCTKRWLGRRGGFFAVLGIVILAVTVTAFLMLWFFVSSIMGAIWILLFG